MTAVDEAPPAAAEAEPAAYPPPKAVPLAPDLIEVTVPRGGRVVVVSDLHLSDPVTDAARWPVPTPTSTTS